MITTKKVENIRSFVRGGLTIRIRSLYERQALRKMPFCSDMYAPSQDELGQPKSLGLDDE